MSDVIISSNTVENNKLNHEEWSCTDVVNPNGRVWSGVGYNNTKNLQCSNIQLEQDLYDVKKGTQIDNYCDCEIINTTSNGFKCPSGKYISAIYPKSGKASCCNVCDVDKKIKTYYDDSDCSVVVNNGSNPNNKSIMCSPNSFITSVKELRPGVEVGCCKPKFKSTNQSIQNPPPVQPAQTPTPLPVQPQQNASSLLNDQCKKYNITQDNCNENNIKSLQDRCKEYGIDNCNNDELRKIEQQCNGYGMRYFDSIDNRYKNTDSYINCHVDNFQKLDQTCKDNSLDTCNFYNINRNQQDGLNEIKTNIVTIDKIQDIYENKISNLESSSISKFINNKQLMICLSIILFLIFGVIIYFIIINKK
jgi:hypothetical protein